MEATYLTVTIKPKRRPRKKHLSGWTIYARLSVLALAAMMTARLALLMIDIIQTGGDAPGAVAIPLYAVWLIFIGWKLREWTAGPTRKENLYNTANVPTAEITLTPAKSVTASGEGATV